MRPLSATVLVLRVRPPAYEYRTIPVLYKKASLIRKRALCQTSVQYCSLHIILSYGIYHGHV